MSSPTLSKLHEARNWLRWRTALQIGLWFLGAGVFVLSIAGLFAAPIREAFFAVLVVSGGAALITALWRWKTLSPVATRLDSAANTKDRFVSWLALDGSEGLSALAREEIDRYATHVEIPRALKPRLAWPPLALLVLAAAVLATGWTIRLRQEQALAPERQESVALLEEAREATKRSAIDPKKAEEVAKTLEEALRKTATSPDPKRDALRALSKAEKSLAGGTPFSQEEMSALAQAATPIDPALSEALAKGPNSNTAEKLSALDDEALQRIVKEAAEHQQSNRLQQLARQSTSAMRQEMVSGFSPSDRGQQSLSDELQDVRMASTQSQPRSKSQGSGAEPRSGEEPADGSPQDDSPPGGGPGSRDDQGKGRDLADGSPEEPGESSPETLDANSKAEGPSAVRTGLTGGDDQAQSTVNASGSLKAAEAAALDAVSRENVPIGSRILVRRYFEDLRSRE